MFAIGSNLFLLFSLHMFMIYIYILHSFHKTPFPREYDNKKYNECSAVTHDDVFYYCNVIKMQ